VLAHPLAHGRLRLFVNRPIAEKIQMLCPWDRDQCPDPPFGTLIQKPTWWHIVDTHQIHPRLEHKIQIPRCSLWCAEVVTELIWRKRAVGNSLDEKLSVLLEEKLGANTHRRLVDHAHRVAVAACLASWDLPHFRRFDRFYGGEFRPKSLGTCEPEAHLDSCGNPAILLAAGPSRYRLREGKAIESPRRFIASMMR
jgi:hypothetical protein